ncbi:MAG: exonuclease domain-containing protein [Bacteroidota bacterium]
MQIKLHKPIIFLDIEATGLSIGADRIVEISLIKLKTDHSTEIKTMRFNPGMPIPEKVSKIHGIYDEDVKTAPFFQEAAADLLRFIGNADLAGYNSNKYDIPLLAEEFLRAECDFDLTNRRLIDVQNIFHLMEPRNLVAAYKFYCQKPLEKAHSAESDAMATYEIFKEQLIKYEGVELEDEDGRKFQPITNDIAQLSTFSTKTKNVDLAGRIVYNENGIEVFSFGKHKDKPVLEVFKKEPSYYNWMMQGDFPRYTKKVITALRLKLMA